LSFVLNDIKRQWRSYDGAFLGNVISLLRRIKMRPMGRHLGATGSAPSLIWIK